MAKLSIHQALKKARSHIKAGKVDQAKELYTAILRAAPNNTNARNGLAALNGGQQSSIEYFPLQAVVDNLRSLYKQGELEAVLVQAKAATAQYPKAVAIWNMLGASAAQLGKLDQARTAFELIATLNPNLAAAHYNLGNVLKDQGELEEAIEAYDKALMIKPDYEAALNNVVVALKSLGKDSDKRIEVILKTYNQAQAEKAEKANSTYWAGLDLYANNKLDEAMTMANKSISLLPDFSAAHHLVGSILGKRGKFSEALKAYEKALELKPNCADSYYMKASIFSTQGKLEAAIQAYSRAIEADPNFEEARVQRLYQQAHVCDWDSIKEEIAWVPRLGIVKEHTSPCALLHLEDAPERHQFRSEIFAAASYIQKPLPGQAKVSQKPKRIRLGYFSTDFQEHPVAYLIAKMLEQHDRNHFEVFGYSLQGNHQSDMRRRLAKSFDSFADVQGMNDKDIALQARQDGIDIAVDLTGYTKGHRTGIFAYRAAPIQMNYLGYPGTLGADFMDYIIADRFLIPQENQKFFTEKPLYLPHTYMPTDNTRELSQKPMSRSDVGLPGDAFVFCCFNNNYKISSAEFDIWMRLLRKVEGSVLWLRKSNEVSHLNMKKEAKKRNIDPSRLVFADRSPMDEHLARQRLADLFVDTFAFNAHTTASEALWAGLPVVTKAGQGFAARVAGSLLNAVGLPELVTTTEQEYEELILELATNPTRLAEVRDKLATNRLTQPLFNTELYTKHLENGYQQAYQNYFDGNPPQTITVQG